MNQIQDLELLGQCSDFLNGKRLIDRTPAEKSVFALCIRYGRGQLTDYEVETLKQYFYLTDTN